MLLVWYDLIIRIGWNLFTSRYLCIVEAKSFVLYGQEIMALYVHGWVKYKRQTSLD